MLMQQRNRSDQRQVFGVVTPHPCLIVAKRQPVGPRHDHRQRSQQTLRVVVQGLDVIRIAVRVGSHVPCALAVVNFGRLVGRLVNPQRQAAVLQFGIGMFRGRGQKHHHGAFDRVGFRRLATGP